MFCILYVLELAEDVWSLSKRMETISSKDGIVVLFLFLFA